MHALSYEPDPLDDRALQLELDRLNVELKALLEEEEDL